MKRDDLSLFSMLVYIGVYISGRYLLVEDIKLSFIPLILDLLLGVLIIVVSLLLKKLHSLAGIVFMLVFSLFHIANMEYIFAMDHTINLSDFKFLGDKQFLAGTLSHFNFPLYSVLLILSGLLSIFARPASKIFMKRSLVVSGISIVFLLFHAIVFPSAASWKESNFTVESFSNTLYSMSEAKTKKSLDLQDQKRYQETFLSDKLQAGESLLPATANQSRKKNVLFVVMEGIPGVYLEKNQIYTGIQNPIKLNSLNKIVDHSLVVPNFITHNNQTIRGLYSILSGDYPKLDASTPKAYEYDQIAENSRDKHLPVLLKEQGYNTAFIQASPLEFMSKDRFMKASGFSQVVGQEGFPHHYIPFAWGIDDKAFFEQSQNYLKELNQKTEPWFATLLTVGTHHPYAVPEDLEKEYPDRKEAAVRNLDRALDSFIDFLNTSGIAKDTLVMFISDESHGVDNQTLGSNWGLCLAYSPDFTTSITNEGVFGHLDLLPSIVDYVAPEKSKDLPGRSIFRSYPDERSILFSSHYSGDLYFSNKKGTINQINNRGELYTLTSSNGQMFSDKYNTEKSTDVELKSDIETYKEMADQSVIKEGTPSDISIIEHAIFDLERNKPVRVTDGQYLTLPAKSMVTLKFDYEIESDQLNTIKFNLGVNDPSKELTKIVDGNNKKGTLIYKFYNPNEIVRYSFYLALHPYGNTKETNNNLGKIHISNLSVHFAIDTTDSFETYDKNSLVNGGNLIPLMHTTGIGAYPASNTEIRVKSSNQNEIMVYGPYLTYPNGRYVLRYKFKMDEAVKDDHPLFAIDVQTDGASGPPLTEKIFTFNQLEYDGEYYTAQVPFEIVSELHQRENMEFRLRELRSLNLTIEGITTERQP
ncbi:LTA synthase family protein [Paenibacillus mucilaginosus]|nr:LTA synthase family protein [Paenibacillus mucilaginosus]AEI39301.1 hypothetical protein KNP414_00711 [Paenibacillus mucilaginosus KNP414]MCG7216991.1 LTA synthase family protein [Paenibacillus mucilaginosus]WDM28300.1 LTA synthase family protein [Paenibacillus mucilaginosus]WFA16475.1 LTA synthase family protein [Paenibacillus mucilaginosus]